LHVEIKLYRFLVTWLITKYALEEEKRRKYIDQLIKILAFAIFRLYIRSKKR